MKRACACACLSWLEIVRVAGAAESGESEFIGLVTPFVLMCTHPTEGDLIFFQARHIANIIAREKSDKLEGDAKGGNK